MQHGKAALEDTVDTLLKNGIGFTGLDFPESDHTNGYTIERNGIQVHFLAYNSRPEQYYLHPPLYARADPDTIRRDIEVAREYADVIAISLHWGDEFIDFPSYPQIELAHDIIDSGADIILGLSLIHI